MLVQLSLDITFYAIECGVTTCPGYPGTGKVVSGELPHIAP